jgi:teichuronic acid exporter
MSNNHSNLLKKAIAWSSVGQIGTQALSFIFGIVLARLILPAEYGLLAMVMVFTGFANIFIDLGFGAAIIQRKSINNDDLSTSFWLNVFIGCFLFLVLYLCAPLISNFYDNPKLVQLVRVVSLNFIITSFSSTHQSLLIKRVDFKPKTKITIFAVLISSVLGISLAYYDYGVWSLVNSLLCKSIIELLGYFLLVKWMPNFVFSKVSFSKLFAFGSKVTLNSFLGYLNRNADNLIIGKFLGGTSLGIYSKVYNIMMMPLRNISSSFKTALFPVFSKIQNDREEIKRLYFKSTKMVAFIVFPLMFGLSAVSEHFTLFLYGDNWIDMVPIMKVLCIFSGFQSIMTFNGTIFYSLGKPEYETRIFLVTTPIVLASFILGIYFGDLLGLVWFYGVTSLLLMVYKLSFVKRLISMNYAVFFKNILNPILFSTWMYLSVVAVDILIDGYVELHVLLLIIETLIGAFVYILLNYLFDKQYFINILKTKFR